MTYKLPLTVEETTIKNEVRKEPHMEFLKEILGDLYEPFVTKINAYNGDEANAEKQIKLANLATGEYVGKGKYDGVTATLSAKQTELDTANALIEELKKGTKGNEDLQTKISQYETVTIPQLQQQLAETKLKAAIKVGLLSANVQDIDYLTFKLREKLSESGETLELDENDNIKGWNEKLDALKTQFPGQFQSSGQKKIEEHRLEETNEHKGYTRGELSYADRNKAYQADPEGYAAAMKNN